METVCANCQACPVWASCSQHSWVMALPRVCFYPVRVLLPWRVAAEWQRHPISNSEHPCSPLRLPTPCHVNPVHCFRDHPQGWLKHMKLSCHIFLTLLFVFKKFLWLFYLPMNLHSIDAGVFWVSPVASHLQSDMAERFGRLLL